jgi:HAD superfamily hydrolase (TIGR01509 family)
MAGSACDASGEDTLRALLWDVDGTVAETERDGHLVAFNQAFEALGLPWRWNEADYRPLLDVTGGRERLLHFMATRKDAPTAPAARESLARELHARKNRFYAERVAQGHIAARPGVLRLMAECEAAGVKLALVTTTSGSNIQALFDSLMDRDWRHRFAAVVGAEEAPLKKPHPQAYRFALQLMDVAAGEAFAIEDAPNGLQAAQAAGIACGITRSAFFEQAEFPGAVWVRKDLDSPEPLTLARLATA